MAEDQKIGGGYVTIGARTDPLEEMLAKSASLTRNTLSAMGNMAREFGEGFSRALGAAGLVGGGGLVAGTVGVVGSAIAAEKATESLRVATGLTGTSYKEASQEVGKLHSRFRDIMPVTKMEAEEMAALAIRTGQAGKHMEGLAKWFERMRVLGTISGEGPLAAAKDISSQMIGGTANFSKYGVYGDFGMFPGIGYQALWGQAEKQKPVADKIAQDERQQFERLKAKATDTMRGIGAKALPYLNQALGAIDYGMSGSGGDLLSDFKSGTMDKMNPIVREGLERWPDQWKAITGGSPINDSESLDINVGGSGGGQWSGAKPDLIAVMKDVAQATRDAVIEMRRTTAGYM